jgi:uncharacterized YigZ family protein
MFVEKKSKFIGSVWFCADEDEAHKRLSETRAAFADATHNCYAYSVRNGAVTRMSDDGEPQGTAGKPILEVFAREGVTNYLCVVTRYFGGILLGAGGLLRAYAHAAKDGLDAAGKAELRAVALCRFVCSYSLFERAKLAAENVAATIGEIDYAEDVSVSLSLPDENTLLLDSALSEMSSGSIRLSCVGKEFLPVRIK